MRSGKPAAEQSQSKFPLAAPAGKDSNARMVAPPGAVNQGPFDMSTWKYGNAPAFTAPPGLKLWNPVKIKLMEGGKVVGGTVQRVRDPSTYCAMANAGYDFIWTEMQHDQLDVAGRRARVADLSAREGGSRRAHRLHRRARDPARARRRRAGARRADRRHGRRRRRQAADWTYFPPLGKRSQGGGPAFDAGDVGRRARAATARRSTTTSS